MSGRGAFGTVISVDSGVASELCADCMLGSSTASSDAFGVFRTFLFFADLAGHGISGQEYHGSCPCQSNCDALPASEDRRNLPEGRMEL